MALQKPDSICISFQLHISRHLFPLLSSQLPRTVPLQLLSTIDVICHQLSSSEFALVPHIVHKGWREQSHNLLVILCAVKLLQSQHIESSLSLCCAHTLTHSQQCSADDPNHAI